ncbi:MAG: RusA family crossover junction endodeoxyribonuclease [Candidatus Electronema sp. V4]|uniref:RusA family crossover junction endodeoxyribonuclease n=1 Tax=Candidatus Electronema sp. V4 TaxID=3454756 RepID=UPI00405595E4
MHFDFLIPKRPVSLQTRNKSNLQAWKKYVRSQAEKTWPGQMYSGEDIHLTLVYLYESDPVDVDNIIKPIQDALVGLVYDDDLLVTDVESHRRPLLGIFDLTKCPALLIEGIVSGKECVYVRLSSSRPLEDYL